MADASNDPPPHATGYCYSELMMWHCPGELQSVQRFIEPTRHWENVETKRRVHNLLAVSGLLEQLVPVKARPATLEEVCRVHDRGYVTSIKSKSDDESTGKHTAGEGTTFMSGSHDIALLAAGAAIEVCKAVMEGKVKHAYALTRPPGHHAERAEGRGFCIYNNVAVAAAMLLHELGLSHVAIVDWDVHHGNGTQNIFYEEDRVLFISLHQDNNYPPNSGPITDRGKGQGQGFNINVPLPPGSGSGAYKACMERVVLPALEAYRPEFLLVSCGFDANYSDPLAAMALSSEDFRWMTSKAQEAANKLCGGRLVLLHEGGYSDLYVPFCGLATMEQLSGIRTQVNDPQLYEVSGWGYQDLQAHQDAVITKAEALVAQLPDLVKQRGW